MNDAWTVSLLIQINLILLIRHKRSVTLTMMLIAVKNFADNKKPRVERGFLKREL